jgi:glyoxylase-like metal-dependent hydrolase (beta-lactamase superfamily II)
MQVHEFVDAGLGHSSYVIDVGDGTAAWEWVSIVYRRSDYVTGSPGLAARRDVTFTVLAASNLETSHQAIRDGKHGALAPGVTLTAIATPGHTPDHHAYALEVDGVPVASFTGGFAMVGTDGRTDLCAPELAVRLAHEMFRSLHRFDDLPGSLAVLPAHGAGSFCSTPGAAERTSTLGYERGTNPLLSISNEGAFVERLIDGGSGTFPIYFARLPELRPRRSLPVERSR